MNTEDTGWSRRYQKALRTYLELGPGASLRPAYDWPPSAARGLDTLDLARIHETEP